MLKRFFKCVIIIALLFLRINAWSQLVLSDTTLLPLDIDSGTVRLQKIGKLQLEFVKQTYAQYPISPLKDAQERDFTKNCLALANYNGKLLIASNGTAYLYDSEKFIPIVSHVDGQNSYMTILAAKNQHKLLFGSDNGAYVLSTDTNNKYPLFFDNQSVIIHQMCEDDYGNVYLATSNGIWRYDTLGVLTPVAHNKTSKHVFDVGYFNNNIYFPLDGIYKLVNDTTIEKVIEPMVGENGKPDYVTDFIFGKHDTIIGTFSAIACIKNNQRITYSLYDLFGGTFFNSMAAPYVRRIVNYNDSTYAVLVDNAGVVLVSNTGEILQVIGKNQGLTMRSLLDIAVVNGKIYLACSQQGVWVIENTNDRLFYPYPTANELASGLETYRKSIWIANEKNSLYVLRNDSVYQVNGFNHVSNFLHLKKFNDKLFVGTDKGVYVIDPPYIYKYVKSRPLLDDDENIITFFYEDTLNKTLFFGHFLGLTKIKNNKFVDYRYQRQKPSFLKLTKNTKRNAVISMVRYDNSTYFLGSEFGVLTLRNNQISVINKTADLYCIQLEILPTQKVLISTPFVYEYDLEKEHLQPLKKINSQTRKFYFYRKNNKLWGFDENRVFLLDTALTITKQLTYTYLLPKYLSSIADYDEKSLMLGYRQMVLIKKNNSSTEQKCYFQLNEFQVDSIVFANTVFNALNQLPNFGISFKRNNETTLPENITLPYDKQLILSVSVNDYAYRKDRKIQYQLNSTEEKYAQWLYLKGQLALSSLTPGNYKLMLRYVDEFSDEILLHQTIELNILPPFWKKTWFILLLIVTVLLVIYYLANRQINKVKFEAAYKRHLYQQLKKTEIKALKAQLNPHYLFNSFSALQQLIETNKNKRAIDYLLRLSKLFRNVLDFSEKEWVELTKEIDFIATYIETEKQRFDVEIDYTINVEVENENCLIPPMLLQPFVENVFKYAINGNQKNQLKISVIPNNNQFLKVTIADTGNGFDYNKIDAQSRGVNLIIERIKLYIEFYEIPMPDKLFSTKKTNGVFEITILIPYKQV